LNSFVFEVEDHLMRDPFNRVLKELDFGRKCETRIRYGNSIESMEELMLARSDLAFGELHFIEAYDQLRLYFVTEWVGEFGLGNRMLDFNEADFNNYFYGKIKRVAEGRISICSSYVEGRKFPCAPLPAILSALTSENCGFAKHKCEDTNENDDDDDDDADI
jgi:hypothetical protein